MSDGTTKRERKPLKADSDIGMILLEYVATWPPLRWDGGNEAGVIHVVGHPSGEADGDMPIPSELLAQYALRRWIKRVDGGWRITAEGGEVVHAHLNRPRGPNEESDQ